MLEIFERTLGAKHSNTLKNMTHLASTYSDQEQWKEAEKLQLQVLKISERTLEAKHSDTLTSMTDLTCTYRDQKQWQKDEKIE